MECFVVPVFCTDVVRSYNWNLCCSTMKFLPACKLYLFPACKRLILNVPFVWRRNFCHQTHQNSVKLSGYMDCVFAWWSLFTFYFIRYTFAVPKSKRLSQTSHSMLPATSYRPGDCHCDICGKYHYFCDVFFYAMYVFRFQNCIMWCRLSTSGDMLIKRMFSRPGKSKTSAWYWWFVDKHLL